MVNEILVRRGGVEALAGKHCVREVINRQRRFADDPLQFIWREAKNQINAKLYKQIPGLIAIKDSADVRDRRPLSSLMPGHTVPTF